MTPTDNIYTAYLFAYFTGNAKQDEAIHFALSEDAYHYSALNGNQPVIASAKISSTGGVRDPHILRAEDGHTFFMAATDMVSEQGWESNRAMILLISTDLINWSSAVVNIQTRFPGNDELLRVWAPQTIYDPEQKRYMIYWSMKHGKGPDIIYYAYANTDFTDLETIPQQLFYHPRQESCIDGDILWKDGRYHLFFKTHGQVAGIQIAVSEKLTGNYELHDTYVHQTIEPVEGSCIFKLNNANEYMMMYDVYMSGSYQFTTTTDLQHFTVVDHKITMDFQPRHGCVIALTSEEAQRLINTWGL